MEGKEGAAAPEAAPAEAASAEKKDAVSAVGAALEQLAGEMPELGEVLDHFNAVVSGGAGESQRSGPVSMEAGASRAVPMSMGRPV